MPENSHSVTIKLTPSQFAALSKLSKTEGSDLATLAGRSIDMLLATYSSQGSSDLTGRLEKMHEQLIKLMVSLMKLVGQAIYFSSLPVTTGPIKARLNEDGILLHWRQSEKFALELLKPPSSAEVKTADDKFIKQ